MAEGWFKIHREIFEHPLFDVSTERGSKRFIAWVWMIAEASHKMRRKDVGGQIITLRRGQFSHSRVFIAEALGWSEAAVERFLFRLKTEQMIEQETGQGQRVITICNYEKYQARENQTGQATGQATGQGADRQRTEPEEGKKERRSPISTTESNDLPNKPISDIGKTLSYTETRARGNGDARSNPDIDSGESESPEEIAATVRAAMRRVGSARSIKKIS